MELVATIPDPTGPLTFIDNILGIAFDTLGDLYISASDSSGGNWSVYQVDKETGEWVRTVTTSIAGASGGFAGTHFGQDGFLYIIDSSRVYKVDIATGNVTSIPNNYGATQSGLTC